MDLDSYVLQHSRQWDRLAELTGQRRAMTGDEADELIDLYSRVSTHLSVVRSTAADAVLEARLSALVASARSIITGVNVPVWQTVGRFFTATFPATVYRARRWWISVGLVSIATVTFIIWRVITVPGLTDALLSAEQAQQLVDHDFAQYYSDNPAADFAFQVWLNNARVTAVCLILGVLIVPVIIVLWVNLANLGMIAGFMIGAGRADVFYGLLLPHGLLELTIIFVAAGAGLRLGWSWIAPGPRTRASALASEGRAAGAMALGLGVWLLVSGLVEGFVTPSRLSAPERLAIGAAVWIAFLVYVFTLGRRAVKAGQTGDLGPEELEATVPQEVA